MPKRIFKINPLNYSLYRYIFKNIFLQISEVGLIIWRSLHFGETSILFGNNFENTRLTSHDFLQHNEVCGTKECCKQQDSLPQLVAYPSALITILTL
jgi:hypothetical protein